VSAILEGVRRVVYGEGATFVPVCEQCGRFVSADAVLTVRGDGQPVEPNATCSRCGRVAMPFEGYV
jgi:hypothetical protein